MCFFLYPEMMIMYDDRNANATIDPGYVVSQSPPGEHIFRDYLY